MISVSPSARSWGLPPSYEPQKSIHLTPYGFSKAIAHAGTPEGVPVPGGVLIYDEAVTGTSARRSASTPNVAINTILEEKTARDLIPRLKLAGGQGIV